MTIPPATNLDDAWRACNPDMPLQPDDDRYVDLAEVRGESQKIINSIKRNIKRSEHLHGKFLFSGHRGSGKSTELLRLKQLLQDDYFCVYIDIEEMFGLDDISYVDVFLSIVEKVTEEILAVKKLTVADDLIEPIKNWLTTSVYTEKVMDTGSSADITTEVKAGGGLPSLFKLMAKFRASLKLNITQRRVVRTEISRRTAEFIAHINTLLIAINNTLATKKLVVIVDGLEKMNYVKYDDGSNNYDDMFVHHAEHLKSLHCHIIYTMPITLAYTNNMGNDFDALHILPMVKLNDTGINKLTELVNNRLNINALFNNPNDVDNLIKCSGGVTRDLMRLIRIATDTDDAKISTKQVDIALSVLSKEYDRLITDSDLAVLQQVQDSQSFVPENDNGNKLLKNRAILEYSNGNRWCSVHPALLRIERIQNALGIDNSQPNHTI